MIEYKIYIGKHLLMVTNSYYVACKHAYAGKRVIVSRI